MADELEMQNRIVFSRKKTAGAKAKTTVIIPLYNYARTICEALDSVFAQTRRTLSLIVVDDCSTDDSLAICEGWIQQHANRFAEIKLVSQHKNSGLSNARNTGFSLADTPFGFMLDADNALYPKCIERCEQALHEDKAAFSYPMLETFGVRPALLNTQLWSKARLKRGNYIDAMALIRKKAWRDAGGYTPLEHGWEDFDLWCSFAEQGWHGVRVPEILARYRVHGNSMLQSRTNLPKGLRKSSRILKRLHPWIRLQH